MLTPSFLSEPGKHLVAVAHGQLGCATLMSSEAKKPLHRQKENLMSRISYATDEQLDLRAIAKNKNTDADTLMELSKSKDTILIYGLATNPSLPEKLMEKFAKHRTSTVRGSVAKNPNLPDHLFDLLAADDDFFVQMSVKDARARRR